MQVWENVARQSRPTGTTSRYDGIVRHMAATFGGRQSEADDDLFRPLFNELLAEARRAVSTAATSVS
jgi:hypothetical protein